jgi:hypothetical protein
MQCTHCDQNHPEGSQFCPMTGKELLQQQGCPGCGKQVDPNWQHCGHCGQKLIRAEGNSNQQKSQAAGYPLAPTLTTELSLKMSSNKPIAQPTGTAGFSEDEKRGEMHDRLGEVAGFSSQMKPASALGITTCPYCHTLVLPKLDGTCPHCRKNMVELPAQGAVTAVKKSEKRSIEFTGTGFQALGWSLYVGLLAVFIFPAAWGAVAMYRWLFRNLLFSDGTKASFEGRGEQIWGYYALSMLLGFAPQLSRVVDDQETALYVVYGLLILTIPISTIIGLKIMRWFFSNIKFSDGTNLNFKGKYGPYLGWILLVTISAYTIIGWAWASVAMIRWVCRNIDAGQNQLEFLGSGWELLWRVFLAGLAGIFIVPIPWVWLWVFRWIIGNISIKQKTPSYHDENSNK